MVCSALKMWLPKWWKGPWSRMLWIRFANIQCTEMWRSESSIKLWWSHSLTSGWSCKYSSVGLEAIDLTITPTLYLKSHPPSHITHLFFFPSWTFSHRTPKRKTIGIINSQRSFTWRKFDNRESSTHYIFWERLAWFNTATTAGLLNFAHLFTQELITVSLATFR